MKFVNALLACTATLSLIAPAIAQTSAPQQSQETAGETDVVVVYGHAVADAAAAGQACEWLVAAVARAGEATSTSPVVRAAVVGRRRMATSSTTVRPDFLLLLQSRPVATTTGRAVT